MNNSLTNTVDPILVVCASGTGSLRRMIGTDASLFRNHFGKAVAVVGAAGDFALPTYLPAGVAAATAARTHAATPAFHWGCLLVPACAVQSAAAVAGVGPTPPTAGNRNGVGFVYAIKEDAGETTAVPNLPSPAGVLPRRVPAPCTGAAADVGRAVTKAAKAVRHDLRLRCVARTAAVPDNNDVFLPLFYIEGTVNEAAAAAVVACACQMLATTTSTLLT